MKRIIYRSKDTAYKVPFGAIATNEMCTFSIDILKEEEPSEVFFVYRKDTETEPTMVTMPLLCGVGDYFRFSCNISFKEAELYFYRFEFSFPGGKRFCGRKGDEAYIEDWLDEWQLTVYDKAFRTPDWAKGAVMYQIFPDRFCRSEHYMLKEAKNERIVHENWFDVPNFIYDTPEYKGNDFFCGNLKGVMERADYLASLGVNVVYFNPIFESPENHRYSTADYTKIDPYLGTNEDFTALCRMLKEKGIRVVLDGVFSHTGADSLYFNKYGNFPSVGAWQGKDSPYYDWYTFDESKAGYECWWGFENLPNVNETHPAFLNFITGENGVLETWQKRGAAGWRLDVADELPDAFLDALRVRVKATDPEALVLGEVWEDATNKFAYGVRRRYLLGKQLDSVMNYPWRTAVIDFIKEGNAALFQSRVLELAENYPPCVLNCLMNMLSTHDTERIINVLGVEKEVPHEEAAAYILSEEEYHRGKTGLMAASVLQLALPGIFCVYYGDEAGLTGFRDPYCRMGYPYGKEDQTLLTFFKALGSIRNAYREEFIWEQSEVNPDTFCVAHGEHTILMHRGKLLFAVNMSEEAENVTLDAEFVTICSPKNVTIIENELHLPPKGYGIFVQK